jgi:hypothetical protein
MLLRAANDTLTCPMLHSLVVEPVPAGSYLQYISTSYVLAINAQSARTSQARDFLAWLLLDKVQCLWAQRGGLTTNRAVMRTATCVPDPLWDSVFVPVVPWATGYWRVEQSNRLMKVHTELLHKIAVGELPIAAGLLQAATIEQAILDEDPTISNNSHEVISLSQSTPDDDAQDYTLVLLFAIGAGALVSFFVLAVVVVAIVFVRLRAWYLQKGMSIQRTRFLSHRWA